MLKLVNVTREYNMNGETTISPVSNVSLTVTDGEFIMIIGRSGSGKTTLLNLAAGLIRPTAGQVAIDGRDLGGMNDKELSRLRAEKLGFVFQFPSLLPSLTVLENVLLPVSFGGKVDKSDAPKRAASLLAEVGLLGKKDVYPKQLSAGEQKRVVIARAFINRPGLLLADEPTSDLDEATEREIMALLREIHTSGVTILMVTHSLQLLPAATRVFKMEKGSLTAISEADRMLAAFESGVLPVPGKKQ